LAAVFAAGGAPRVQPGLHHKQVASHVTTTQVAPTILKALGLDPQALHSMRKEGTESLPALRF
jgi:hypothetical protein